ncbi:unnamed protein product [Tilletia caries]|uniref:Zinc knuckle CX2CX3GHX4C domain-containing protein n=1 Tax=Tilletia caries TaxID=13290 RepID=A0ABN7J549_9BASI|nr:unnamed protein product [Tilletia caries]
MEQLQRPSPETYGPSQTTSPASSQDPPLLATTLLCSDTRQTKTKRKRIKRNDDLAPEQKEKKLEELRKFDPSAWPKKNFKRIKKDLKKKRELAIEKEIKDIKASTAGQSSSSSSKKGPPQQPAAAPSGSGTQKPKPFRDNVPKGPNPCSRCGSKVYHDSRKCMAEALAADTTKKTFAITNA